ncbi:MAG: hypothetical protein JSV91_06460 [Phycisphaerales bacterium]|nr:MAG: hypothetical protein JSV91_06460 [Phycisphaerales bacterium]
MSGSLSPIENPIVLLEGGTGVGTSTFSLRLAAALNIPVVVNTDFIREALRTAIAPEINPAMGRSTYLAGRTSSYERRTDAQKRHEIIHGYKMQCSPIQAAVDRIVKRAIKENRPILIEGVHIQPGRIRETDWYQQMDGRIVELFLYIDDPEVHKQRFIYRQKKAPDRPMGIYLENFREIRWIHDYLLERAERFDDIYRINNVERARDCMKTLLEILATICPDRIVEGALHGG